jgi:hypothetical protein
MKLTTVRNLGEYCEGEEDGGTDRLRPHRYELEASYTSSLRPHGYEILRGRGGRRH